MPAARLLRTLKAWLRRKPKLPCDLQAGKDVIEAIDARFTILTEGLEARGARAADAHVGSVERVAAPLGGGGGPCRASRPAAGGVVKGCHRRERDERAQRTWRTWRTWRSQPWRARRRGAACLRREVR